MRDETLCLHAGYTPKNGEPRVMPIVQSTTYVYDSTADVAAVFDDPTLSLIYSRFANPTVMAVEDKIAALEGGVGAMCTTSGQAATLMSVLNICQAGDSLISVSTVYGGTINLFSFTLKKLGIECIYVSPYATDEELNKAFKPNTKLVFGETIANPALSVLDIERFANAAHAHGVPLIVDNTFATPVLCKPFDFGADIVVHSTSKYLDGHARHTLYRCIRRQGVHHQGAHAAYARFRRIPGGALGVPAQSGSGNAGGQNASLLRKRNCGSKVLEEQR